MITYEQAASIAISNTIPDGKVYCSGETKTFYYFIVVEQDFPNTPGAMFGRTYTAVNKSDGDVWDVDIADPRMKDFKILVKPGGKGGQ